MPDQGPEDLPTPSLQATPQVATRVEALAFTLCTVFAVYVAIEPVVAGDDCISLGEILVLLPYYALLYFGTLPLLIGTGIWRIALAKRMSAQRRKALNATIGILCVLLFLEAAAYFPSNYTAWANRCLDLIPSFVLVLWIAKIWLSAQLPRGAHS